MGAADKANVAYKNAAGRVRGGEELQSEGKMEYPNTTLIAPSMM